MWRLFVSLAYRPDVPLFRRPNLVTAQRDVEQAVRLRLALATLTDLNAEAAAAFGINQDTVTATRTEAMSIPAIRRGRSIVVGVAASLPLVQLDDLGNRFTDAAPWVSQPNPNTTQAYEVAWTVDDMLFSGRAWWRVTSREPDGYPASFERISLDRITVTAPTARTRGQVYVDGRLARDADLVRFDALDGGLLVDGGRTIQTYLALDRAVKKFARLDVPLGYLRPMEGTPELSPTQIDDLLDEWETSRETRTTAFLNRAVEYATVQFDANKIQLAEARQLAAVDCARLLNLAPSYVAAPSGDSSTYSNVEGNRRELVDLTLAPFLTAIGQRLSMGDVSRPGRRVAFDRAAWMRGDLLSVMQAAEIGLRNGAIDAGEMRTDYLGLPARTDLTDKAQAPTAPAATERTPQP